MTHILDELMWTFVAGDTPSANGFKCRWCDCFIGISDPEQLDLHLEQHVALAIETSPPGTTFQCGIFGCHLQCSSADDLRNHVKHHYHHAVTQRNGLKLLRQNLTTLMNCGFPPCPVLQTPEDPPICEWNYCESAFADICAFVQHCKDHVKTTNTMLFSDNRYYFVCQWKGCQSKFSDRYDLERHLNTHTGCKTCACPFCGRYISSASRLIDHVNRNVEGSENFVCFLCNKTFASQRLLREHCERHVRTIQCSECPLVLQRESDLRAHIEAVHQKNRQFWCEFCSRSYMKKSDLTKHLATHTGNTFRCAQCDMKFTWQKQLKHHMLTHDQNYIKSPYLCHICGSTYQRGSALSKHLRTFHKLTVPHGFTRFQFKKCQDKMYRLETQRVLSDELKSEINNPDPSAGPSHSDYGSMEECQTYDT